MHSPLLLLCRGCGAPLDAGPRAALVGSRQVLLDVGCPTCGKRALYELSARPA